MPTQHPKQPNSNNDRPSQSRDNEKLPPPQRSRGAGDVSDSEVRTAIAAHVFNKRLQTAACWARGELPPDSPFTYLWHYMIPKD